MSKRTGTTFSEGLNKLAALLTRSPSRPILVDGAPWTGENLGDVAIVMSSNNNVVRQHVRIAGACIDAGLDVILLYSELGGRQTPDPANYEIAGARIAKLPLRWRRGPLRYPNTLVRMSMLAELDALWPTAPFKVLITHHDRGLIHGLLVYWCRRRGIPSVVVQEGMTVIHDMANARMIPLMSRRGMRTLASSLLHCVPHALFQIRIPYSVSDFFFAYGEAAKTEIVRLGRDPATVLVVGNPSFDDVTQPPAKREIPRGSRNIVYAEQHIVEPEQELRFFNELARICCDQNNDRLVIKMHPLAPWKAEDITAAVCTSEKRRGLVQVIGKGNIVDMLGDADVLITIHSTSAYHAFIRGIPLITIHYLTEGLGELDAYRYGGAIAVRDESELEKAINDALDEEVREKLHEGAARVLADHLFRLDGQASKRIAQAVVDLSQGRRPHCA